MCRGGGGVEVGENSAGSQAVPIRRPEKVTVDRKLSDVK
jgi:hypothetical protein